MRAPWLGPILRRAAVAWVCIVLSTQAVSAATLKTTHQGGLVVLTLSGAIEAGDAQAVRTALDGLEPGRTVVALDSGGGRVVEALAIGRLIRAMGLPTAVLEGRLCASACGLIWLAGSARYAADSARIGFHTAYTGRSGEVQEARPGNALIAEYLGQLGLPAAVVDFVTAAPPAGMTWLHPAQARQVGISFVPLPPELAAPAAAVTATASAGAAPRAAAIAVAYFELVSQPGFDATRLAALFAPVVVSFGQEQSRDAVLARKARFLAQWPQRRYTVRPDSLAVRCDAVCSVAGIIDWAVASGDGAARDGGAARFTFGIAVAAGSPGGIIVAEDVTELAATGGSGAAAASASSGPVPDVTASAGYAEGRRARAALERWGGGLPRGDYRRGAAYWIANRATQVPLRCDQAAMPDDWQRGCADARSRVAPSVRRLQAEPDFALGWNSAPARPSPTDQE